MGEKKRYVKSFHPLGKGYEPLYSHCRIEKSEKNVKKNANNDDTIEVSRKRTKYPFEMEKQSQSIQPLHTRNTHTHVCDVTGEGVMAVAARVSIIINKPPWIEFATDFPRLK